MNRILMMIAVAICMTPAWAQDPPTRPLTPCLAVDALSRPIYPTTTFASGGKWMNVAFHLNSDEKFKELTVDWVVVDVGEIAPPGYVLASATVALNEQSRDGSFNYSQDGPLPVGRYKAVVKADGQPWNEVEVAVADDAPPIVFASPDELFPLVDGKSWQYDFVQSLGENGKVTEPGVKVGQDGKVHFDVKMSAGPREEKGTRIDYRRNNDLVQQEWWVATSEGIMVTQRVSGGQTTDLAPPSLILAMPHGPLTQWDYQAADGSNSQRYRMWGPVPIHTPEDEQSGYLVWCKQTIEGIDVTDVREFVPHIGLVKETIVGAFRGKLVTEQVMTLGAVPIAPTTPDESQAAADRTNPVVEPSVHTPPYRSVANDTLAQGVGRVVVEFPAGVDCGRTQISVFSPTTPDKALKFNYGRADFKLAPGRYIIEVCKRRIGDVDVVAGQDAKITVGALHVTAPDGMLVDLLDMSHRKLNFWYGSFAIGLPVGEYLVKVSGQETQVSIRENEITEF